MAGSEVYVPQKPATEPSDGNRDMTSAQEHQAPPQDRISTGEDRHETLKHQLLGPSLLKAGQDSVDQRKVNYSFRQHTAFKLNRSRSPR